MNKSSASQQNPFCRQGVFKKSAGKGLLASDWKNGSEGRFLRVLEVDLLFRNVEFISAPFLGFQRECKRGFSLFLS